MEAAVEGVRQERMQSTRNRSRTRTWSVIALAAAGAAMAWKSPSAENQQQLIIHVGDLGSTTGNRIQIEIEEESTSQPTSTNSGRNVTIP